MDINESKDFGKVSLLWEAIENPDSVMAKFKKIIETKYKVKFDGYWDLHQWSVDNIVEFWAEMWDFSEIICSKKYEKVVDINADIEDAKWFEGAKLNYAENILKYRDNHTALILLGEDKEKEEVTFSLLYKLTSQYAAAFRKLGLENGDVVCCYMSNRKEAVLAMLAAVSIGAIWSGAFPLLGATAVLSRLSQLNPKVLVTVDRFPHNKKKVDLMQNIQKIVEGLPSLKLVVIVPSKETSKLKDIGKIRNSCFLHDFLRSGIGADGSIPIMKFEQVSVSHPVLINFTSGTTGLPKPLLHGSGVLVSLARNYRIHCDSTRDSVWFSSSPVGWIAWNIFTYMLNIGCKLILFEGNPYYLTSSFIWNLIDDFKITHMFSAPSVLEEFEKRNYVPTKDHKLTSLKYFGSGGSIVKPSVYDFMHKILKAPFSSSYGSTEIMGSSFLRERTLPIYRGEINCLTLGNCIECLNEQGRHVIGEVGELVFAKPSPNLLLGIWGDKYGTKCRDNYYSKYNGKFCIGDFGIFNPITRGLYICGRSDDCLKQRGCRFGSSEIYNIVERFPEVRDSLCVSHFNKSMDERAVLFLKMMDGIKLEKQLVDKIRSCIATELTPRHVPDVILETEDIPYNMIGKKMEILVKNIINNRPFNVETISNPDSLCHYKDRPELQDF